MLRREWCNRQRHAWCRKADLAGNGSRGPLLQAVKQLSGTVAEIAQMIEGAPFNLFLGSNQEKCSNLWATIQRLDTSVVNDTGDLIDKSFRQAPQSHMILSHRILSHMNSGE